MRMILTQNLTNYASALFMGTGMTEAQPIHSIKNAPMYRFQAIAHIGQGSRNYDAHSIVKVGALHLLFDDNWLDYSNFHLVIS
jgi:hypothetical protein